MGDITRAMGIIEQVNKAGGTLTVNHLVAAFGDVRNEALEKAAKIASKVPTVGRNPAGVRNEIVDKIREWIRSEETGSVAREKA